MPTPDRVTWAPTDVLRLAVATAVLAATVVLGALFHDGITDFLADLLRGLDAVPEVVSTLLVLAAEVLAVVLVVAGLVVALRRRAWRLVVAVVVATAVAVLAFVAVTPLLDDGATRVVQLDRSLTPVQPDDLPGSVAVVTAVVTAAAPWVARRWRRAAWTLVILVALVWFLGSPITLEVVVALLCGWFGGALAVAALGAPSLRPTVGAVRDGLEAVGVGIADLAPAAVDARGSTPYFATTADGRGLFVKVLGEDERSADLLFRLARRLVPHDLGDERPFSSLRRAVEHEALVALAVRDLGVRTPRFVAFASADPNGFVLAYERIAGRSLDRLTPDAVTDDVLLGIWSQVARMRAHRVAHRDLRLANVFIDDDGAAWVIDFGFSELAASDLLLATDVAELLASSATVVGVERAAAVAATVVGPDGLVAAVPRLRSAVLSGATRRAVRDAPGLLGDLRARVERAASDGRA